MDTDLALNIGKSVLDLRLFEIGGTPVSVATLILLSVFLAVSFWLSRMVERGVTAAMRGRQIRDEGNIRAIGRLVYYLVAAVGLGIALQTAGFNLSALFAAGAVFAVGLGFAFQNLAQNFVSGVLLLLEQSITPGDILEVEGHMVRVVEMRMRTTVARTRDDEELIIPNATLVEATVKNYSLSDRIYRLRVVVGVVYGADMEQVRAVLERMAEAVPWRLPDRAPVVMLIEFGASSVNWEVSVWLADPWEARPRSADLHEAIWFALREADIAIAFPQLDLHLDPPALSALRGLREARGG